MTVLGIETATERLSAALVTDDQRIFERHEDSRSAHCELLAKFITELTAEAGITLDVVDGVAVSAGPGSFTGLRIGIATAMGLAYGLGVETCGIGTLDALAWNTGLREGLVCPLIDAKRSEAYAAVFRMGSGRPVIVAEPAAIPVAGLAALLADLKEPVTVTGPAALKFRPLLENAGGPPPHLHPSGSIETLRGRGGAARNSGLRGGRRFRSGRIAAGLPPAFGCRTGENEALGVLWVRKK